MTRFRAPSPLQSCHSSHSQSPAGQPCRWTSFALFLRSIEPACMQLSGCGLQLLLAARHHAMQHTTTHYTAATGAAAPLHRAAVHCTIQRWQHCAARRCGGLGPARPSGPGAQLPSQPGASVQCSAVQWSPATGLRCTFLFIFFVFVFFKAPQSCGALRDSGGFAPTSLNHSIRASV